jgi:murein L,D-transpeptidase YafK
MGLRLRKWGFWLFLPVTVFAVPASREWVRSQINRLQSRDLNRIEKDGRSRMVANFAKAKEAYPPRDVTLIFLKDKRTLDLYARSEAQWKWIKSFPVFAASGGPGPKLKEGDLQVPEGIYKIELLNPNSRYHLSLRINYPNEFDRARAREEKRTDLGGDIMIHGNAVSIGCIAIGDRGIEEVFALARDTNFKKWKVLLAPTDLRKKAAKSEIPWMPALYEDLKRELEAVQGGT